jgi:hypothetical protein
MTAAQLRLVEVIRTQTRDGAAEFWPVVNDWVKDAGPAKALALRNINRTVDALVRKGIVTIDDDGLFHLASALASTGSGTNRNVQESTGRHEQAPTESLGEDTSEGN